MRVRFGLPLWALLLSIPVAVLALNCGPANLDADSINAVEDVNNVQADEFKQVMDTSVDMDMMTMDDATELNLEEGAGDEWRRRRGYYRRGYRGWGYGWGWPYYGYSYAWPYYGWYY